MENNKNLNLVVYSNSKGNYNHRYIWKATIEDLKKKIDLDYFASRVVHIKDGFEEGSDELIREMTKYFQDNNFNVLVSEGEWKHGALHHKEYLKDIINVYKDETKCLPGEYILQLEQDFCFVPKEGTLEQRFNEAIELLQKTDFLTVRFPAHENELWRINNVKNVHPHLKWMKAEQYNESFIAHNENFSFNPNICRKQQLQAVTNLIEKNLEQLSFHCETAFSQVFLHLFYRNKSQFPYAVFDPSFIQSFHLGEKNFPELLEKLNKIKYE